MYNELGFELLHLGINAENTEEAEKMARLLGTMFGFDIRSTSVKGFFCGPFEIMGGNERGRNGHIAIGTTDIVKAVQSLKERGFEVDQESYKYDNEGNPKFVYLSDEVAGFAIHLIVK